MKEPYIVLDIETTGLSKHANKITEIAAVKISGNKINSKFQTLINPKIKISPFITSLTGIDNQMVKDSPPIEEVMPRLVNFLENHPIVAHCASFDHGFISHNAQRYLSKELINQKICTRKLSRRLIPELKSYKLSSICGHFKITNASAHRAMPDVEVTNKIFDNLLDLMKKRGVNTLDRIINFQDSKISKTN
jgi:DNA polymerase III subunit alpha, Gram-positive type